MSTERLSSYHGGIYRLIKLKIVFVLEKMLMLGDYIYISLVSARRLQNA